MYNPNSSNSNVPDGANWNFSIKSHADEREINNLLKFIGAGFETCLPVVEHKELADVSAHTRVMCATLNSVLAKISARIAKGNLKRFRQTRFRTLPVRTYLNRVFEYGKKVEKSDGGDVMIKVYLTARKASGKKVLIGRFLSVDEIRKQLQRGGIEQHPGPNGKMVVYKGKSRGNGRSNASRGMSRGAYPRARVNNMVLYKRLPTIMPEQFTTDLIYTVQKRIANNGGTLASNYLQDDCFDVDPDLGSTAMAGFGEFSLFFEKFRPESSIFTIDVWNNELFAVAFIFGASARGAAIGSGSLGLNYSENPNFQRGILGLGAAAKMRLTRKFIKRALVGTDTAYFDDLYSGLCTSGMSATSRARFYFGIIAEIAGSLTAAGVTIVMTLKTRVTFFRRNLLIS